ncbi:MAG: C40 family peptidase [Bacteroidales bacterium]
MKQFICENVFVPLRAGPAHRSEMLSQILFGEKYIILDQAGKWIRIESLFDKYAGWIDQYHLQHSDDTGDSPGYVLNRSLLCFKHDGTKLVLEAGCEIYNPDFENKTFTIGRNIYNTGQEFSPGFITPGRLLTDSAMSFINSPYIWGGRIPSGIDCSGFTQLVYKIHGIPIPRDSVQQAEAGTAIGFIDETIPGDLVFFDNDRGVITHVGMILSRGLVIHASGRVRIDPIDHQGIFKHETGDYSHHLRTIRRIL